jgi:hypothetical protein
MEIAFLGELLIIHHFLILIYFIVTDYLSFFILLMKKKLLIKYFFIINVPINYPPLSKKSLNLSNSCPIGPKKIRKIQKNPKKSEKNPNFSPFFLCSHPCFYQKSTAHLASEKNEKIVEKKVEKKVVFIFANFFLKIHFGHFFMSNFKIKKKVLKTSTFSIFRLFLNYCLSSIF